MTAAHARIRCCRDRTVAAHHDRLLRVDVDVDALLELLEMAVTWHELDYGPCAVVGPAAWSTFVEDHEWTRRDRAEQAFALAVDIVGRGAAGAPPVVPLAPVISLVGS